MKSHKSEQLNRYNYINKNIDYNRLIEISMVLTDSLIILGLQKLYTHFLWVRIQRLTIKQSFTVYLVLFRSRGRK